MAYSKLVLLRPRFKVLASSESTVLQSTWLNQQIYTTLSSSMSEHFSNVVSTLSRNLHISLWIISRPRVPETRSSQLSSHKQGDIIVRNIDKICSNIFMQIMERGFLALWKPHHQIPGQLLKSLGIDHFQISRRTYFHENIFQHSLRVSFSKSVKSTSSFATNKPLTHSCQF